MELKQLNIMHGKILFNNKLIILDNQKQKLYSIHSKLLV